jgi:hypothetical protein
MWVSYKLNSRFVHSLYRNDYKITKIINFIISHKGMTHISVWDKIVPILKFEDNFVTIFTIFYLNDLSLFHMKGKESISLSSHAFLAYLTSF